MQQKPLVVSPETSAELVKELELEIRSRAKDDSTPPDLREQAA
jgi:hypothetical protein